MLRAAATPAVARQLAASAVAVILPSSGSSNATGQITHTTALGAQPTGTVKVFLPAGVVTAGSQGTGAGLYDAIYSSTTVCQLTGTGIVTANAAYTQVTTEQVLSTTTVPAGAMGLTGGVASQSSFTQISSAGVKTFRHRLGGIGGSILASGVTSTVGLALLDSVSRNRASASNQVSRSALTTASGVSPNVLATTVNTAVAQDIVTTGQLAVATDFLILENRETWLLP